MICPWFVAPDFSPVTPVTTHGFMLPATNSALGSCQQRTAFAAPRGAAFSRSSSSSSSSGSDERFSTCAADVLVPANDGESVVKLVDNDPSLEFMMKKMLTNDQI